MLWSGGVSKADANAISTRRNINPPEWSRVKDGTNGGKRTAGGEPAYRRSPAALTLPLASDRDAVSSDLLQQLQITLGEAYALERELGGGARS
jgi:hypothetical protein